MVKKKKYIFQTLKTTLHTVTKHQNILDTVNQIVLKINQLRCHMLQFTKLYFLHLFHNKQPFPIVDRGFFQCVIRTLTVSNRKRNDFSTNKDLFENISHFYSTHYKDLRNVNETDIDITSMRTIVNYMITDVITDLENNIKMRFYNHLKNYVNCLYNKNEYIHMIRRLECDKEKRKKLINIKLKLINKTIRNFYDQIDLPSWLSIDKVIHKETFKKASMAYDIQCEPQDYIKSMLVMNCFCEYNDYKTLHVFPLKRSIIPGHIRLDTESIVDLFVTETAEKKSYKATGGIEMFKDYIWNQFFKTDKRIFNSENWKFHGSIQTDGFSISILHSCEVDNVPKVSSERYIDEISKSEIEELRDKTIIATDPNKDDLIYCITGSKSDNNFKTFRYTNNQRSKETRKRKHKKILLNEKELDPLVTEKEKELSEFSSKTLDMKLFTAYIQKKNEINVQIKTYYERVLWRKLRLSAFVRKQTSEMKMVDRFKKVFGGPEESFVAFGDWSQKNQMKFKEPTKGKSLRTLLRKAGYSVFLVDEYKTSKQCCNCRKTGSVCENFLTVKSPRPWKKNVDVLCHGLVKCKTCKTMFNRDTNSTVNIREITMNVLNRLERPEYLSRKKESSLSVKADKNHEAGESLIVSEC